MKILITAGPTREYIDPVRFISNPSTGKMGFALARAASVRGHHVCLVCGPVSLPEPDGARLVRVETAAEMLQAVAGEVDACDALIMSAAVCDWRPTVIATEKMKKSEPVTSIPVERTVDILGHIRTRKGPRRFVGFAAETQHVIKEAQRKLIDKGLDLIVANDVSQPACGFAADTNQVTLITAGHVEPLPMLSKDEVADRILTWLEAAQGAG